MAKAKKPNKIVAFPKQLRRPRDAEELALLGRKPYVAFSQTEDSLMNQVSFASSALYVNLAFICDDKGLVQGTTYDSLRKHLRNDDLTFASRSMVRSCLLELSEIELIEFDTATGTKVNPTLAIVLPYQSDLDT